MKLRNPVFAKNRILFYSVVASFSVLLVSIALQWLVYDDWLHQTGPVHLIGSAVAAVLTFVFVLRWFRAARERALDAQRRFTAIAAANDRIRNKLQAIECITYVSDDGLADSVRDAMQEIDMALRGIIEDYRPGERREANNSIKPPKREERAGSHAARA